VARQAERSVLAVVPARGGSKGLPRKNLRLLAGSTLLEHAIRFAQACDSVGRVVVSTDSEEIAAVARSAGADVPFLRPPELAADDTPMWTVLVHALKEVDPLGDAWQVLLLVDPTVPIRSPADFAAALERLDADPNADGIVSVAEPGFNIVWQSVVEEEGYMAHLVSEGVRVTRRQGAPPVWYIDGSFYLWRSEFVRSGASSWFEGRTLMQHVESYGSVDTAEELRRLEALVAGGIPLHRDDSVELI
jgi:CMP-N,N'-diacetyllegionaminic acid synthase